MGLFTDKKDPNGSIVGSAVTASAVYTNNTAQAKNLPGWAEELERLKFRNEYERKKLEMSQLWMGAAKTDTASNAISHNMAITHAVNGGFTMTYQGKLYIAKDAQELAEVIISAMAAERMTK